MSNINDEASVYRNNGSDEKQPALHYLNVQFRGDTLNKNGFGAKISVFYNKGEQQVYEHSPYRGYLSTLQQMAHIGLGKNYGN